MKETFRRNEFTESGSKSGFPGYEAAYSTVRVDGHFVTQLIRAIRSGVCSVCINRTNTTTRCAVTPEAIIWYDQVLRAGA